MNASNSFAWFVTMLMAVFFVLSVMGCGVAVPTRAEIKVVRSQDMTIDDNDMVSMAPRRLLEEITNELKSTHKNIEIVDGLLFRDTAFPEGGWRLGELFVPEVRRRVNEQLNLDYLALVGAIETSQDEEKGFMFPGLLGALSVEGTSTITAIVIDLRTGELVSRIVSEARGTAFILNYIIILAANEPQIDSGTAEGLAREIGKVITELAKPGKTRLAVLALEDVGTSSNVTEKKKVEALPEKQLLYEEETLKLLLESAELGDPESQYQVFLLMSTACIEPVSAWKWLCRAADLGYENAQIEVAYWHRESNWEFAQADRIEWLHKANIRADDRIAYLWYTLASNGDDKRLQIRNNLFSETLSKKEIAEARDMVRNWKPGLCPTPYQQASRSGQGTHPVTIDRLRIGAER